MEERRARPTRSRARTGPRFDDGYGVPGADDVLGHRVATPPADRVVVESDAIERWRDAVSDLATVDRAVVDDVLAGTTLQPLQADLLLRLGGLPQGRSPMNVLAAAMRVSGSSLTKLVDRLSDLGLARRDASDTDRRVVFVVLTEEGGRLSRQLRARYVATLRARVLSVVGADVLGVADVARGLG